MRYLKIVAFAFLTMMLLVLSGCGGSSGSATTDPLSRNNGTGSDQVAGTIYGNVSTATGKTGIALSTDRPSIDVNNGQVLVTAKVLNSGMPVPGVPVTFGIVAPTGGPASIEAGMQTATTDSNGTAITRISAGNIPITTNVIVSGKVTIGGQTAIAQTTFQIVRGGGVIMFNSNAGTTPGGQGNLLEPVNVTVPAGIAPSWDLIQLIPFKVTDANGNPRVGVPITLSLYSLTTVDPKAVTIDFLVDPVTEPNQQTITSDFAGQGVFSVSVGIPTPPADSSTSVDVVYKAVTNDAIPVTAYVGGMYTLTAKKPDQ